MLLLVLQLHKAPFSVQNISCRFPTQDVTTSCLLHFSGLGEAHLGNINRFIPASALSMPQILRAVEKIYSLIFRALSALVE